MRMHPPLHTAILEGQLEAVALLIDNGADLNARNYRGCTPLHVAVHHGDEEIVGLLLESAEVDIIADDDGGYTPLHTAIDMGNRYIIDMLVDRMCDEVARSRD